MRFSSLSYTLFICCLLAVSSLGQTAPTNAVDPQAASILANSFQVMAGPSLAGILSTRSTAQISYPDGTTATSTILTQGNRKFRVETDASDGTSVFVLNGSSAASQDAAGHIEQISSLSVATGGITEIPLLSILGEWATPGMKIVYVGEENVNGLSAYRIQIQRPLDPKLGLGPYDAPCDLYVDAKTMLPVELIFPLRAPSNLRVISRMKAHYSDYQSVSGILIPYRVTYSVGDTVMESEQVTQFSVNVATSPSDFELR